MRKKTLPQNPLSVIVLCLLLVLSGCALPPISPYPPPSTPKSSTTHTTPPTVDTYEPKLGRAASLYQKAETSLSQGHYRQAELELERALRIEPRNAHYWHTMARIKYHQKHYEQTIQFCLKSKSLAGSNRKILSLNDSLIAKAQRAQSP